MLKTLSRKRGKGLTLYLGICGSAERVLYIGDCVLLLGVVELMVELMPNNDEAIMLSLRDDEGSEFANISTKRKVVKKRLISGDSFSV